MTTTDKPLSERILAYKFFHREDEYEYDITALSEEIAALERQLAEAKEELIALRCKPAITKITELDTRWQELVERRDEWMREAKSLRDRLAALEERSRLQKFADDLASRQVQGPPIDFDKIIRDESNTPPEDA